MKISLPTKFTGIIQLEVSDIQSEIDKVKMVYPDLVQVSKFHITLMHQSYPKKMNSLKYYVRGDKALKELFNDTVAMSKLHSDFDDLLVNCSLGFDMIVEDTEGERTSVAARINDQEFCQKALELILDAAGLRLLSLEGTFSDNELCRVYHVSLLNKTGNGGDSLAYPNFDR